MKKIIKIIQIFFLFSLLFLGCQREILPEPALHPMLILFTNVDREIIDLNNSQLKAATLTVDYLKTFSPKEGDQDYFILKSNTTWKIISYPSWVTVSPLSGSGNTNVIVRVKENIGTQRTGVITISGTGLSKNVTINVLQSASTTPTSTLSVDYLKIFSYIAGDQDYFVLKSNTTWKIVTYPDWVTISPLSGTGNANVYVTVKENVGIQRTGVISIAATGINTPASLNVVQLAGVAAPYPRTLNINVLKVFSKGIDTDTLKITTNTDWIINGIPNWLSFSSNSGTNDHYIIVKSQANNSIKRTVTLSIIATGISPDITFKVEQEDGTPIIEPPVTGTTANYYVATNGSDSNPGTIDKPFATWQKGYSMTQAGQLCYIRGGLYKGHNIIFTGHSGTSGKLIKLWAYPGEKPILRSDVSTPDWGILLQNIAYIHLKGLEISYFQQGSGNKLAAGIYTISDMWACSNSIFENLDLNHNAANLIAGDNNRIVNCDFHDNKDPNTGYGNADGIDILAASHSGVSLNSITYVDSCRSWNNGDDNFDCTENNGLVVFRSCWAWHAGYASDEVSEGGDGNGFKFWMTPNTGISYHTTLKRRVINCITAANTADGMVYSIDAATTSGVISCYNNTSYNNGNIIVNQWPHYGFSFDWGTPDIDTLRNNVSYKDKTSPASLNKYTIYDHNSWDLITPITLDATDFISLDYTELAKPRDPITNKLPVINFLKPSITSKLKGKGINGINLGAF